ncbi:N-6 DNA methylase [Kitasatospora terrestris]|uniref:DNA methylase adenine-specific domain-containing protein n=1 Tax=Kitasatospora terrestris TaxID=258051 RepID=A0ABP9DMV6_9ACTN
MNESVESDGLLSRSEISERTGVARPAVTNWERRYADYPSAVRVGDDELFDAREVAEWLSTRVIPRNNLRPGEPHGTTYGDRFVSAAAPGPEAPGADAAHVRQVTVGLLDVLRRSPGGPGDSSSVLLIQHLLHIRGRRPESWERIRHEAPPRLTDEVRRGVEYSEVPFARGSELLRDVPDRVLQEAVHLIGTLPSGPSVALAFDTFLAEVARWQGRRGHDVFTPGPVREVMLAILDQGPSPSSIHDPFCRAGELLVEAVRRWSPTRRSIRTSGSTTLSSHAEIAALNLAVHSVESTLAVEPDLPASRIDAGATARYDIVLSNPPFSLKAPSGSPFRERSWPFGPPPEGNADLGWIQHAVVSLARDGRGAVVMPHGASFRSGREQAIRARLVEAGVVECLVSLRAGLFTSTGIPVMLWFLRGPGSGRMRDVLMIDAARLGGTDATGRATLSANDVSTIAAEYRAWRSGDALSSISAAVAPDVLRAADYNLTPARYVRAQDDAEQEQGGRTVADLRAELDLLALRAARADAALARALEERIR